MKFNLLKKQQKQTENKEKSCGRSMVEMLGILAIIGVLSIGGIQGYTMAMRRYRANEILAFFQQYAVNYYTSVHQKMLNDEISVGENGWWVDKDNKHIDAPLCTSDDERWLDGVTFPSDIISVCKWGIISTNSGDFIIFTITVSDKQLCQTIVNITGETGLVDRGSREQCENDGSSVVYFTLSVAMN